MAKRVLPDELMNPVAHEAAKKTVVETVLKGILAAGNSVVSLASGLLAAVLVIYSGYVIADTFNTEYKAYTSAWDLLQYKPEIINDGQEILNANKLAELNEDYRAWLTVYNTSIDYPVVQGEDDLYYAWHDIYRNSSLTGAIYLAAQNSKDFSDSYNLIYGHHMSNGAMFGRLDSFRDANYYNAHRDGIIITKSGAYDIKIFAVASTDAYESQIYTVGNRALEVKEFLTNSGLGGVGIGTEILHYDPEVGASATKILALSTCASAETNGRLVVFGKMTQRSLVTLDGTSGYEGVYDAEDHEPTIKVSVPDAKITYSLDGGKTWTDELPKIHDVGEIKVIVRAETEANGTDEVEITLKVKPKPVTVTAKDLTKTYGSPDPTLAADVAGLIGQDHVNYTLQRDEGEKAGTYAIRATGERIQGNYEVTFVNGTLTITGGGGGGGAKATPVPDVTLTIKKNWENDEPSMRPATVNFVLTGAEHAQMAMLSAANSWTGTSTALPGDKTYTWVEPKITGYTQKDMTTNGTVTTVTNVRTDDGAGNGETYDLIIKYRYPDGSEAAPAVTQQLKQGDAYDVESPAIEGYTATLARVTGVMGSRNTVITVFYMPADDGQGTKLVDTGAAVGVPGLTINLGDCFE